MRKTPLACAIAALGLASSAHAFIVSFNYTQTDFSTGAGTIAPFSFNGHNFTATNLPAATVVNPGGAGLTPAGFVAAINAQSLNANESNAAAGLLFSGLVTATSTDGFAIDIPLVFVSKQTQTPTDTNDYNWNVAFGDNATGTPTNDINGVGFRFAFYLGRDSVVDNTETANMFQRYTQEVKTFVAAQDNFTNTDTTTTAIKDAEDPAGAPLGTDAAGRDLAFYYGYRDGGTLGAGQRFLVDTFTVGGALNATDGSLRAVPEPSTALLAFAGLGALALRRRR